jgi:hypothetical protein
MKVIENIFFVLMSLLSNFSIESYKLKVCEYIKNPCLHKFIELNYN